MHLGKERKQPACAFVFFMLHGNAKVGNFLQLFQAPAFWACFLFFRSIFTHEQEHVLLQPLFLDLAR